MIFEVYNESVPTEKLPIRVRLVGRESGELCLGVVGRDGNYVHNGLLLRLCSDGRIYRYKCVDPDFGFPLDHAGRLCEGDAE